MTKKRTASPRPNVPAEEIEETRQADWLALLRNWQREKLLPNWHAGTVDEPLALGRLLAWVDLMLKKWAVQHLWGTRVDQRLKETEQRLEALEQWRLRVEKHLKNEE